MSVISNSLRNLSAFLENHQVSFSNGLLILFTIGGEHIFRFNAFKCPCNHEEAFIYALIFMLVPAVVLGIIGVVVSNLTWRIFHGCRSRLKTATNGYTKSFGYLIVVIARASVVPFAWLFIALLDGNYYACMWAMKPCDQDTQEILHLKSMSQNIAWLSLGGLILVSFIVICCVRCCDSVTYLQYKYLHFYREAEQDLMDKHMQEFTKNTAKENVEEFLKRAKKPLKEKDFDDISKARQLLHKINLEDISRARQLLNKNIWDDVSKARQLLHKINLDDISTAKQLLDKKEWNDISTATQILDKMNLDDISRAIKLLDKIILNDVPRVGQQLDENDLVDISTAKQLLEKNDFNDLHVVKQILIKNILEDISTKRNGLDKNDWDKVSRIPDHCLSNKDEGDKLIVFLSPLEEWMHQNPAQAQDPTPQPEVQMVEQSQQENVPKVVIG